MEQDFPDLPDNLPLVKLIIFFTCLYDFFAYLTLRVNGIPNNVWLNCLEPASSFLNYC